MRKITHNKESIIKQKNNYDDTTLVTFYFPKLNKVYEYTLLKKNFLIGIA